MWPLILILLSFFPHAKKSEVSFYLIPRQDSVKALLYLSYNAQDMIFKKTEVESFEASIEIDVEVFGKDGELLYGNYWDYIYTVPSYKETKKHVWYSKSIGFILPREDEYKVNITVKNKRGGIIIEKKIKRKAPALISDPIPVNPENYKKGIRKVESIFIKDSIFGVYIYNNGETDTFSLKIEDDRGKDLKEWREVLEKGDNLLVIPITEYEPGSYTLSVKNSEQRELIFYKIGFGTLKGRYYKEILAVLSYIASYKELDSLKKAQGKELERVWRNFWKRRDPTPETPQNEFEEEFWRRVEYADEHFSSGLKPGYKSDRGIVYIKLGPPDEIERHPFDLEAPAYEIWYYYNLNYKFIFMDKRGVGDYELVYPPRYILDELLRTR